ncbi:MAG: hypothetical protein PHW79_06685, partial [Candidatus Marinimicrobia bacterium]|nr:hypothetical protein [Candidatus Neomarinimicrobiota bacterium]
MTKNWKILFLLVCFCVLSGCSGLFDPTAVFITEITLDSAPTTDSEGNVWDASGAPDFYYILFDNNGKELRRGSAKLDMRPSENELKWKLSNPYKVTDFDKSFIIAIYDEDIFDDDFVSTTEEFTMNDYYEEDSFILENDDLTITIGLDWEYPFE